MHNWASADTFHRTGKLLVDASEVISLADAEKKLRGFRVNVFVGREINSSPTLQAMLLTIVNTGRRCFLGGVYVIGKIEVPLLVPWNQCKTLAEAVLSLQGLITQKACDDSPAIVIGSVVNCGTSRFAVRATFNGWSAGIAPVRDTIRLPEQQEFIPSGVLAGAMVVSEAFQALNGYGFAGHRKLGMSLWAPNAECSWLDASVCGPEMKLLPSNLWIIGLGHLGQALLWTLGFLPYANPEEVSLVLQDFDSLTLANDSTSPLTFESIVGMKKTRAMAAWCDARGFKSTIIERAFNGPMELQPDEPHLAFCGVDNAHARSKLEQSGFNLIFEAGLGSGPEEFSSFQVHTFPGPKRAKSIWGSVPAFTEQSSVVNMPAYEQLRKDGLGDCGVTMLAGRSVGAAFVGTATAAIVVSSMIRYITDSQLYAIVDGSLKSMHNLTAIENTAPPVPFNPGIAYVRK